MWFVISVFILIAASMFGSRLLAARWRRLIQARDLLLVANGYFVGRSIDEAVTTIGHYKSAQHGYRRLDDIQYYWSSGDQQVSLIADAEGVIGDYVPPRQPVEVLWQLFLGKNGQSLVDQSLWDVIRKAGWPQSLENWDKGRECARWRIGENKYAALWVDHEICTEVVVDI